MALPIALRAGTFMIYPRSLRRVGMHHRPRARVALIALLTFAAAPLPLACKSTGAGRGEKREHHQGTAQDPWLIGVSQCNLGEPWRVQMNEDLKRSLDQHDNLRVIWKDAQNSSLTQRAQVGELVDQRIDLLIISPKESAPLTKPIAEAFDNGVPVVVLDRAIEGDRFTTFIGADNKKIGREAGLFIGKTLSGKGFVVELQGLMTSTPAQDRHQGFLEGLAKTPNVKVVFAADMQWLEPKARIEMDAALATQKSIDLVYAHNDPGAHGAYLAAKGAGREKNLKFVGIDALPHEGVQYVKDGILDATFAYPTGGAEAVEAALRILGHAQVPKTSFLGSRLFTKENVERGGEEIQ
ncbi:MAG: hypothetical protein NVSMB1_16580 [Polyangiales bacterium]